MLSFRHLGTVVRALGAGVADNDLFLHNLLEELDELVVDARLDVDTRSGSAHLTLVHELTNKAAPLCGLLEVCVVEAEALGWLECLELDLHDSRRLATEFKGDVLCDLLAVIRVTPSSLLRLLLAAPSMILRPVAVDPTYIS